ncbi:MAG: NAD(P)H-dependent oxidoreductase [Hyphomonadaceae bacterium]
MQHALIVVHPAARSFTLTMADAYSESVRANGGGVIVRDLYDIQFEPRLADSEIPRPKGFCVAADVERERDFLATADVFAFFYPLWFNTPPAIVSGYIQRVFGMGFGYGPREGGANQPLLTGRRLICFTSSGAPEEWLNAKGQLSAIETLFSRHWAEVCGLSVLNHVHFGCVTPFMRADAVERCAEEVRSAAAETERAAPAARTLQPAAPH